MLVIITISYNFIITNACYHQKLSSLREKLTVKILILQTHHLIHYYRKHAPELIIFIYDITDTKIYTYILIYFINSADAIFPRVYSNVEFSPNRNFTGPIPGITGVSIPIM